MDTVKCPLCGFEFRREETVCAKCPLAKKQYTVCCPRCRTQIVEGSALLDFLSRIWGDIKRRIRPAA